MLPQADVPLHAYSNATSSHSRQDNWDQIKKVAQRKSLPIPKDLIEGTMKVIWVTVSWACACQGVQVWPSQAV